MSEIFLLKQRSSILLNPLLKIQLAFFCAASVLLLVVGLGLVACSAKKQPISVDELNKKVTFAVALVMDQTLPEWTTNQITTDLTTFKNIRIESGQKVLNELSTSVEQLQKAKITDDLKLTSFPFSVLFYITDTGGALRAKTFNFYTHQLTEREITDALANHQNWVTQDKTGLVTLVSQPESAEFYVDYQFVGISPIVVNLLPGRHLLSVTLRGKVFHTESLDPRVKSDFQFDDIIIAENQLRDKDGIEMTSEERVGAAVISSMMLIFLSSLVVLPILLL